MNDIGKVYLVGAGPGNPELITVKGLALVRRAQVIIYDRLIPTELLAEARSDAELIDAGKMPQQHRLEQAMINHLMIEKARAGFLVVRLKGGDSFVFGRGGEEVLACRAAGIPVEVVPGISSAIAVPASAGIPVTHRGITASFTVISGHEEPNSPKNSLDYEALARLGTLVILMAVGRLPAIAARLMEAGMSGETAAVAIEWGTTAKQRVVEGTLATLPQLASEANIQPPAIFVIGEVVKLRELLV